MWSTAWAPKPRSAVQRHLPHCLPASLWGGWESLEAAEESLWQETHLYHWEICHHRPQQRHHLEWYSPQDQYGWWTTLVCAILVPFGSAELVIALRENISAHIHLRLQSCSPIVFIPHDTSRLVGVYPNTVSRLNAFGFFSCKIFFITFHKGHNIQNCSDMTETCIYIKY